MKEQDKILNNIREHEYDVIVATSVAEEGLDIPECELIIQMDPPTTVTALVQIRGRARKQGSGCVGCLWGVGGGEGLNIPVSDPECELIIQMDPPTTVTALVQIRGRARKQGSR